MMTTYYEILKLAPSASQAEIETAVETEYNNWRRLVTHHDPKIVDEANRALRTLEQIRTTLMDPAKRADYDQSLNVGGLADPEALLRTAAPPPASPGPKEQASTTPTDRLDAWVCQKCQAPNAVGLQFCSKCGGQIGHNCPKCQKMIELGAPFCAYCGAALKAAMDEKAQAQREKDRLRINELQEQIHANHMAVQELEGFKAKTFIFMWEPAFSKHIQSLGCLSRLGIVAVTFGICGFCTFSTTSSLDPFFDGSVGWVYVILLLSLALGVLAGSWLAALFLKPVFNSRIQGYLDQIAKLEQNINEIKRSGLSNL